MGRAGSTRRLWVAALLPLALPALQRGPQRLEFTGNLEWLSPTAVELRLSDARLIELAVPAARNPIAPKLAATLRIGDRVTVEASAAAETAAAGGEDALPALTGFRVAAAASDGERAQALASPAWRRAGNLLPSPELPPAGPPPADSAEFAPLRQGVLTYLANMPNYIATETSRRIYPEILPGGGEWMRVDDIQSDLSWDGRVEAREHILRDGEGWNKSFAALPGIDWTGGFAGRLHAIFAPGCGTVFTSDPDGSNSRLASFHFQTPADGCAAPTSYGYQSVAAGAEGTVEIARAGGQVARLVENLVQLPPAFPIHSFLDGIEWGEVAIDNKPFWLPLVADEEVTIGHNTYQVHTEYKQYRRFGVSTSITIH